MSDGQTVALSPETVLRQMKENGVTDVVWLPDSDQATSAPLKALGRRVVLALRRRFSAFL